MRSSSLFTGSMRITSPILIPYFLFVMVILLANVRAHTPLSHHNPGNDTTWELLQAIANRIPSHNTETREWDVARHQLWETYRKSTTSERPKIVKDLNKALTHMEYVNSRIAMAGMILFGPEKARSTLRSVRPPERIVDDVKCFKSTLESFEKHCCLLPELRLRHMRALANICNYVAEKAAINEALIVSCAMTKTKKYGVDIRHPSVEVTPAPLARSLDNYCARVFVNGTSRNELESFARPYRVFLAVSPEIHQRFHFKVQICFHSESSRGLCKCGNDEWKSLQNGTWTSVMSPYEQRFVDVKYTAVVSGSVTVTLLEVSQGWRYVLLVLGISLLMLAPVVCNWIPFYYISYLLSRDDDVVCHSITWVIRVIALTCVFQSSIDTPLAIVAVLTCFGLYLWMSYVMYLLKLCRCICQEPTIVRHVKEIAFLTAKLMFETIRMIHRSCFQHWRMKRLIVGFLG